MIHSAVVLRHIHFEDLGTFDAPLRQRGYDVAFRDVGDDDFLGFDPLQPDLLIVLGGPIGVYEEAAYPFVVAERRLIAARIAANRATLGICLGAQFIAAAAGARVFASGVKEIGFSPLRLTPAGEAGVLRHLAGQSVLHWHGDTYDLPSGATNLASTEAVAQQAFSIGRNILGLQFHLEVDPRVGFERWLVGHAVELAAAGVNVSALRSDTAVHGAGLVETGRRVVGEWLDQLVP